MGLISQTIKRSQSAASADSSVENDTTAVDTPTKEIDWEERHFQICLALLGRTDIGTRGNTLNPNLRSIISTADEMVKRLIEHHKNAQNQDAES